MRMLSRSETPFRAVSWVLLRDQRPGWDHFQVLLSIIYRLLRLSVPKISSAQVGVAVIRFRQGRMS